MASTAQISIRINGKLLKCLKLACPALRHAAGLYENDEPVLTAGEVRAECRKAYLAIVEVLTTDHQECKCVLPEQSCPACREAAHKVYGSDGDELPY